ncbi:MAG: NAD-dependent epimerase/dehydratase family protein, partial [Rhodospirillaceae bacterium]|nr:NAD-dependent epimerase/dehydratase family protein [Rhodospirillaceae bacterium]
MTVLVTGAAGFIGSNVAHALLDRGDAVIGFDNMNDYYDVTLKEARLRRLELRDGFSFLKAELADREAVIGLARTRPEIDRIVHLAAQAGVRHSLTNPHAYTESNIEGQLNILELARALPDLKHLTYASSSSVYGGNDKAPFSIEDRVEKPVSLYAATKRAGELMAYCYSHLYAIPTTGLRFFTVYGPWGRPDMSAYIFTKAIFEGRPIKVFNNGDMRRDFTFIDDIVAGILAALDRVPSGTPPQMVYNLGNNR